MKLGGYAILRLALSLLPAGAHAWLPWVAGLCTMNIIYGGFVAMAQKDLKFIIGYSSSSHMGYVLLGLAAMTPLSIDGAVLLMFAHGVMTALSFAMVGHIYDITHTRYLPDLGGIGKQAPFIAVCGVIAAMASSGLPGSGNVVAELTVFLGAWDRHRLPVILGVIGGVITSVYMLRVVRGVFHGPANKSLHAVHDASTLFTRLPYLVLIAAITVVGCWPQPMLRLIDTAARPLAMRLLQTPEPSHVAAASHAGWRP